MICSRLQGASNKYATIICGDRKTGGELITQRQARQEALKRASGAIQTYLDEGCILNVYEDLPERDINLITREIEKIKNRLLSQVDDAGESRMLLYNTATRETFRISPKNEE